MFAVPLQVVKGTGEVVMISSRWTVELFVSGQMIVAVPVSCSRVRLRRWQFADYSEC